MQHFSNFDSTGQEINSIRRPNGILPRKMIAEFTNRRPSVFPRYLES